MTVTTMTIDYTLNLPAFRAFVSHARALTSDLTTTSVRGASSLTNQAHTAQSISDPNVASYVADVLTSQASAMATTIDIITDGITILEEAQGAIVTADTWMSDDFRAYSDPAHRVMPNITSMTRATIMWSTPSHQ